MQAITSALVQNRRLRTLVLDCNRLGSGGASHVAHTLAHSTTLRSLSLYNNDIGAVGAQHLAHGLAANASLVALESAGDVPSIRSPQCSLRSNQLGSAGVRHIARALAANSTLASLCLSQNGAGPSCVDELGQTLAACSVTRLDLSHNDFGDDGLARLAPASRRLTHLKCVHGQLRPTLTRRSLASNGIAAAGVRALGEAWQAGCAAVELVLDGNVLAEEGCAALAPVVVQPTLASLSLVDCRVGDGGAAALQPALVTAALVDIKCETVLRGHGSRRAVLQ